MRGQLCATAHPDGCAVNVAEQIGYVRRRPPIAGARRVLVIGASNGLGLSARITAAFGSGAATVGVCLERQGTSTRTATSGWYNCASFERAAADRGLVAHTVMGDAFSDEVKQETVRVIGDLLGTVDLVVYSLAAPRRRDPATGILHRSTLKTIGTPFTGKSYDFGTETVTETTLASASDAEIRDTVAVMGGADWARWLQALGSGGVLAPGATTVSFSYVGPDELAATYRAGTIGRAKEHLEATARTLTADHRDLALRAHVAVMKALVTQSSTAIPMTMLYTMVLFRVMRELGLHEGPVEQAYRLFAEQLAGGKPRVDGAGRIRMDDLELRPDVQHEVRRRLALITTANLDELSDRRDYHRAVLRVYGFGCPGIDYSADVDPVRPIPSLS